MCNERTDNENAEVNEASRKEVGAKENNIGRRSWKRYEREGGIQNVHVSLTLEKKRMHSEGEQQEGAFMDFQFTEPCNKKGNFYSNASDLGVAKDNEVAGPT